jgi:hypothetical protein
LEEALATTAHTCNGCHTTTLLFAAKGQNLETEIRKCKGKS